MSWHALIESIGARIEFDTREELHAEALDMQRAEEASVRVMDRLRGAQGNIIEVRTLRSEIRGRVAGVGSNWVLVADHRRVRVIPEHSIVSVRGLTVAVSDSARFPLTLNVLLRRLIGEEMTCYAAGNTVAGELGEVGSDYLVLSEIGNHSGYSLQAYKNPASDVMVLLAHLDHIESGMLSDWPKL